MSDKKQTAKRLLNHYFRLLAEKSGIDWDNDYSAEVDEIIDCIFDGIEEEIDTHYRQKHTGVI